MNISPHFLGKDPMWNLEHRHTMPKHGGVIIDPIRIENPAARREYVEQWRTWCVGRLPHQIPSFINDLFREEQRLLRRYDAAYADEAAA